MAFFDLARVRRFTAVALLLLGLTTAFTQRLSSADGTDQETSKLVSRMIPRFHLSRGEIDDNISGLLLDSFLKNLDPQKLYFLKSDISEFEPYRTTLDDAVKAGDMSFCYLVFDRYKKRVDAQMAVIHELIKMDHDFTIDETIEVDAKKQDWCASQSELNERWRKRVKFDLLQFKLDGKTMEEARERLDKRYRNSQIIVDQYTPGEEVEIFLTTLSQCFDPHSTYMSPHSWENFEIQLRLSLDGIGAALRADDGYTVVAEIVPGGAAAEDGSLKVGDKITGVGQDKGDIVETYRMKLNDVVRMVRGPRGTIVRLQVTPASGGESKIISLTRKKIELKESEVKGEIINTMDRLGRPGRVGIISLPTFYRDFAGAAGGGDFKSAAVDVGNVLNQFERDGGVDIIIVDLRNNGGGALPEAVEVSGHFIDRGPVVQVKDPSGAVQALEDRDAGVKTSKPIIVLDNRLSASASEIFAGVIKDYKRGLIIGDTTTHGKGTVQSLMDVAPREPFSLIKRGDRGKLKLTIQQFYRVNGESTQNYGVRSDVVLPSLIDHWDIGEASLERALPFDTVPAVKYSEGRLVTPEIVSALQKSSEERITKIPEFQKLNRSIERYLAKKDRTQLTLNEETARKERVDEEVAKKESEELESGESLTPKPGEPLFPKRFYEDEVLNIALDYVGLLRGNVATTKPQ